MSMMPAPTSRSDSKEPAKQSDGQIDDLQQEASSSQPTQPPQPSSPPQPPQPPQPFQTAQALPAAATRTVSPTEEVRAAWQQVRAALKDEIGESAFNSWVEPLTLISTVQGVVRLAAPSRFMRDRVEGNYGRRLRELWRESLSDFWGLELVLAPTPRARTVHPPLNRLGYPPVISYKIHPATATWNERFRFDSFLEGESNKFVLGMSKRIADGVSSPGSFFFHSRVGLGKTHLLHAIGHSCTLHRSDLLVGYITAERFLQEFVRSLRQREAIAFKDSLSRLDVLLLDDLQFIGHAPQAQQELSHLVSSLLARGSSVVVTADCEFGQIRGLSDRLRSRLCGGAVGEIASPDRDLRVRILLTRSEELGFSLPEDVLNLLAERIVASVRELEGGLKRLYANSQITGEQITVEMAYTVLRDLLSPLRKRVTILDIQRCVARHFDLQMEDMFSAKRDRRVVRPRQVAMFLAKSLTVHSLPEIGRHFGGRDHTTVLYAIRRIEDLRSRDSALDREIEDLGHELQR